MEVIQNSEENANKNANSNENIVNIILAGYYSLIEAIEKENGIMDETDKVILFNGYIAGITLIAPGLSNVIKTDILDKVNLAVVNHKI
ncbi:hypothetical protein [Paenibacillus illinoisensis]|uniref:hypothetical protein n=1 Tax=Paenibacillus illinoisensis TaxID=59845 RepID=UPI003016F912